MKKTLTLGLLLALAAPGVALAQQAREAILEAETSFASQAAKDGTANAFISNSTAASMVVENGQLTAAQKAWQGRPLVPGARLSWYPVMADVAQSGELGYTTGPWVSTQNNQTTGAGEYVTVWHKEADGKWKFVIDMGVEHSEAAAPPASNVVRPQLFAGPATPIAAPAHAILDVDHKFAKAELHKPLETYLAQLSTEARLLRPGQLALVGPTAQVALSNTLSRAYLFMPTGGYLSTSGDLGYVYGTLRRPHADSKQAEETGSYLRIWRREAVAGWRIVLEVLNETTPAVVAPATATTPATAPVDGTVPGRQ